jgi:hypothetical protein
MGKILLEKHADGKLYANRVEIIRYLLPDQRDGKISQGKKFRKELNEKQMLNACILDALRTNPQLIPDEWKTGFTHFEGTVFCNAHDCLCVESLYWDGGKWDLDYGWLEDAWDEFFLIAAFVR